MVHPTSLLREHYDFGDCFVDIWQLSDSSSTPLAASESTI